MSDEMALEVLAQMAENAGDYAEADRLREPAYDQTKEV